MYRAIGTECKFCSDNQKFLRSIHYNRSSGFTALPKGLINKPFQMSTKRESRKARKHTIHDVAREANVSIYSVSRALNNKTGVNPEARKQILDVSRRLGLRPRRASRHLQFSLVVPKPKYRGDYTSTVTFELFHELSTRRMGLTLFPDAQTEELTQQIFDGIFVLSWDEQTIEGIRKLENTPVVVINRFSLAHEFHVVGWDHHAEGRAVAEYLIDRAHRRAGFIAIPPANSHSTQSRLNGFRSTFEERGKPLETALTEVLETESDLVGALSRLVERNVDSIYFPGQELLGIEALKLLQTVFKLKVPNDISLVAGEISGWSEIFDPPLTTVDAPFELLVKTAVDHMLKLVKKQTTEPTEVLIDTKIIERNTVMDRRDTEK